MRRLADAGVGAVVLYSLFEEQLRSEAAANAALVDAGSESFAESLSYFPATAEEAGPQQYLSLLERSAAAVEIPVIGSLNGVTREWLDRVRARDARMRARRRSSSTSTPSPATRAPRAARSSSATSRSSRESRTPSPSQSPSSSAPTSARPARWRSASTRRGANGLVLFNRFLQPDIDPETLAIDARVGLSSPAEARLPRTWIALLHGRVRASLAATTGVETAADVAKYLLAGADVVMTASALLRHGPEHATVLLDGLSEWIERKGFEGLGGLRGLLAVPPGADETVYERAGYVNALRKANSDAYGPW